MKITKEQLKQLIKEELGTDMAENCGPVYGMEPQPFQDQNVKVWQLLAHMGLSPEQIDQIKDVLELNKAEAEVEDSFDIKLERKTKMKITKAKLKQIVKEELGKVMKDAADDPHRRAAYRSFARSRTVPVTAQSREETYKAARLAPEEAADAEKAFGTIDEPNGDPNFFPSFIETTAYEKLYTYFSEAGKIPYDIDSQSRDADRTPDEWIRDTLRPLPAQTAPTQQTVE